MKTIDKQYWVGVINEWWDWNMSSFCEFSWNEKNNRLDIKKIEKLNGYDDKFEAYMCAPTNVEKHLARRAVAEELTRKHNLSGNQPFIKRPKNLFINGKGETHSIFTVAKLDSDYAFNTVAGLLEDGAVPIHEGLEQIFKQICNELKILEND